MELVTYNYYGNFITELKITDKVKFFKYIGKGLFFSISGLGLTKVERELVGSKFMKPQNRINIYMGKIGLTIDITDKYKDYEKEHYCYSRKVKNVLKDAIKNKKDRFINWFYHLKFKKQYEFLVCRSFEEPKKIKTDMLTAFQLASNYEADLMLNGKYLLSPLGFEWEENAKLIKKYLGRMFVKSNKWNLKGYADYSDVILIKQ